MALQSITLDGLKLARDQNWGMRGYGYGIAHFSGADTSNVARVRDRDWRGCGL